MNLPNKITLFRVCVIPVFLYCYLAEPFGRTAGWGLALALFAAASLSDWLDGYIARRCGLITNFGKLMDPLADKMLVSAAMIAMTQTGILPAWAVVVMVSRELFISGYRQLALERGLVLAASFWAKSKTVVQLAMILYLLLPVDLSRSASAGALKWGLVGASVALSLVSAAEYVYKNPFVLQGE